MKCHEHSMRRALELAKRGIGKTWPNPPVGAVVVKQGKIVGEGYHQKAGTPHAEVHALRKAGIKARGATLYVTLEPCCHHGRTPPCTEAILAAGITTVVIGTRDPNPLVAGKGAAHLKRAGLEVEEGVFRQECHELILPYTHRLKTGRPFVTCKFATTLDGKIATQNGMSKWITSVATRRYVHQLRDRHDAILVGVGTAIADDPRLSVRLNGRERVKPVVLVDSTMRSPRTLQLLQRPPQELIIATTRLAPKAKQLWAEKAGHHLLLCRSTSEGHVSFRSLLKELSNLGFTSLFVEGGGEISSTLFRLNLVDHVVACMAPKWIGGKGRDVLPGLSIPHLNNAIQLTSMKLQRFGNDLVIEGGLRR